MLLCRSCLLIPALELAFLKNIYPKHFSTTLTSNDKKRTWTYCYVELLSKSGRSIICIYMPLSYIYACFVVWRDMEKEMATHSSILAWRLPWAVPGGLQSMGLQRVRHDWTTNMHTLTHASLLSSMMNYLTCFCIHFL